MRKYALLLCILVGMALIACSKDSKLLFDVPESENSRLYVNGRGGITDMDSDPEMQPLSKGFIVIVNVDTAQIN